MNNDKRIISADEEMQLRLLKLTNLTLDEYAGSHDADLAINLLLSEIGKLLDVSEAYVLELKDDAIQKTYIWNKCSRREGGNSIYDFEEWKKAGLNRDMLSVSCCSVIPHFDDTVCLPAGAYSYLIGNYSGLDRQSGCIVAADRSTERCWSENESMLLKYAAKMLSIFLIKMRDADNSEQCVSKNKEEEIYSARLEEPTFDPNDYAMRLKPVIDLKSGEICGAEVSLRWINSKYMPAEFNQMAENDGLIVKMNLEMTERIFSAIKSWINEGMPPIRVSLRLNDDFYSDESKVQKIGELLAKYSLPLNIIEVEINAEIMHTNNEAVTKNISKLRNSGIRIALYNTDDGISLISLLRTIPIDVLKFSRVLFGEGRLSEKERKMLTHFVRMTKSLDVDVLCQDIDNAEQADVAGITGCDFGQGEYYGSAKPVKAFMADYFS